MQGFSLQKIKSLVSFFSPKEEKILKICKTLGTAIQFYVIISSLEI